jgi:hypothetical protein
MTTSPLRRGGIFFGRRCLLANSDTRQECALLFPRRMQSALLLEGPHCATSSSAVRVRGTYAVGVFESFYACSSASTSVQPKYDTALRRRGLVGPGLYPARPRSPGSLLAYAGALVWC